MADITVNGVLGYGLAAMFLIGAGVNAAGPRAIRSEYANWGYPAGAHYVVAALYLAASIALIIPATRIFGAALGAAAMATIVGTLAYHGKYRHMLGPTALMALAAFLALRLL